MKVANIPLWKDRSSLRYFLIDHDYREVHRRGLISLLASHLKKRLFLHLVINLMMKLIILLEEVLQDAEDLLIVRSMRRKYRA